MFSSKNRNATATTAGLALLAAFFAVGCSNNDTQSSETASAPVAQGAAGAGDATAIAAGKAVFAANNCANCHKIGDQGGGRAPDLTHVAAEAGHTTEWLMAHVKNPKTHNLGSRMPSFEGKINDQDLSALGAYLASLK